MNEILTAKTHCGTFAFSATLYHSFTIKVSYFRFPAVTIHFLQTNLSLHFLYYKV